MIRWIVIGVVTAALAFAVGGGAIYASFVSTPPASLTQPSWTLTTMVIGGRPLTLSATRHASLRFDATRAQVTGDGGCNSFVGSYSVNGGGLRVDVREMTAMACWGDDGNAVMSQESRYLQALSQVTAYQITGRILTLTGASGQTALTFLAS